MTPVAWLPWDERAKARVRRGPHQWHKPKRLPWPFCTHCGLLALKNEVTRKAMRAECMSLADCP